jgi:hypothetical protein
MACSAHDLMINDIEINKAILFSFIIIRITFAYNLENKSFLLFSANFYI